MGAVPFADAQACRTLKKPSARLPTVAS